ncbi:hypothetical protein Scep_013299 [Stephania cephalantha]|uniref:F-box domain-containing protein n=1 Tax=Stephania cephalantha TaxID=152367 RepID=A0AAP0JI40_9MAGN
MEPGSSKNAFFVRGSSSEKVSDDKDIISGLHDSIIYHILSFLDMKYVVQTCVLSKRWENMWKTVPNLSFKYVSFPLFQKDRIRFGFMDFVDMVLYHRGMFKMRSFKIACGWCCNPLRVNSWLLNAINSKVEEVHISVDMMGSTGMPPCLYSCETLRILKLENDYNELVTPEDFYLPNLKSLHLVSVVLSEKLIADVFAKCPALETLIFERCLFNHMMILNISSLVLKTLVIKPEKTPCYLHGCRINISAPNLISFICRDFVTRNYFLENLFSLEKAYMDLRIEDAYVCEAEELHDERRKVYAQRMIRCLSSVQRAKTIIMSPSLFELVSEYPRKFRQLAASFVNLTTLRIQAWLYRNCLWGIVCILKNSPRIEVLILDVVEKNCVSYQNYQFLVQEMLDGNLPEDYEDELRLEYPLRYLKHVEIRWLQGCISEFELLQFLLRNAVSLKVLKLTATQRRRARTEETIARFYEKLKAFSSVSPELQVSFSMD